MKLTQVRRSGVLGSGGAEVAALQRFVPPESLVPAVVRAHVSLVGGSARGATKRPVALRGQLALGQRAVDDVALAPLQAGVELAT